MKLFKKTIAAVKQHRIQVMLLVLLGFIVRLYRINYPLLDWHSFRQADTASVTYRYITEGIDLLHPKYHDISSIQSGQENPEGLRMVEFPFINALIASFLKVFPTAELVIISRLFSVFASLGTMVFLYWFIKQLSDHKTAASSLLFFCFLPFSIYYSRVILPEPYILLFLTGSLAFFLSSLKKRSQNRWWLSLIFLSLALLLKPFVIFFAPVYLATILIEDQSQLKKIKTYLFPIIAIIPFILWRRWITNFPEGIPASNWLFNGDGIRLRPAWFRWLFWERMFILIGGIISPIIALFNFKKIDKNYYILISWWISVLIYFAVIATGNVRHDYYQVLILPAISMTFGRGFLIFYEFLRNKISTVKKLKKKRDQISLIGCLVLIVASLIISWQKVKGFFNVNHWEYHRAGTEANQLLPQDAKVIAPAHTDTMFLFQTKRVGWPIGGNINKKIEAGATHYISTNFDEEVEYLEEKYLTVKKTSELIIIDLTNPRNLK